MAAWEEPVTAALGPAPNRGQALSSHCCLSLPCCPPHPGANERRARAGAAQRMGQGERGSEGVRERAGPLCSENPPPSRQDSPALSKPAFAPSWPGTIPRRAGLRADRDRRRACPNPAGGGGRGAPAASGKAEAAGREPVAQAPLCA